MQVKKQQLELDMEQQTGCKLGKEYAKVAYLTIMQSTSCEMPGWMKHKLESRLPGEISIASDMQGFPKEKGFPGGSEGKAFACNTGDPSSIPGLGRSPGEGMQPTPVFLPGKSHGQRSLVGYSPWGRKESDTTERLHSFP